MTGSQGSIPAGPARQCARCGALGTHYLTCPSLRLPPRPGTGPVTGGRPGRLCGGPDHPDWPLPPRR